MTHGNAFDIPELRFELAQHLCHFDRMNCALVCRAWHRDFQFAVWERAVVRSNKLSQESITEWITSFKKNAHRIKHLRLPTIGFADPQIRTIVVNQLAIQCRSLLSLEALLHQSTWPNFCQLLANNKRLRRVSIVLFGESNDARLCAIKDLQLDKAIMNLVQLQSLEFGGTLTTHGLARMLQACPWLESIALPAQTLSPESGSTTTTTTTSVTSGSGSRLPSTLGDTQSSTFIPRLKNLEMDGRCDDSALHTILEKCPNLEALRLSGVAEAAGTGLCQVLQNHFFSLSSLRLVRHSLQPHTLHRMMSSLATHRLSDVCIGMSTLQVMQTLVQHHHKTLKHLWILIRSDHEEQLMEILVHCTQLERLEVQSNAALDIRHLIARPWVCVNLKVLHAPFRHCLASIDPELVNLARSEKEKAAPGKSEYVQTQSLFMFRLGRLTRLRSLDVSQLSGHRYPWEELRWTLPYGLAHLAGLSRLEAICFYGDIPFRIRDLKFMKTHCRSLKMIGCSKIKLIRVQKWLYDNWPQLTVYDGSFTNDRMQSLA